MMIYTLVRVVDDGLILLQRELYKKREDLTKTRSIQRGRPSVQMFSWDEVEQYLEIYHGIDDE